MRLTRQSEIAIGILAACARRPAEHVQTGVVANETGVTKPHTAKVVHLLMRSGFLTTARGPYGGLGLARPAEDITLGAVLRHTQPELVETGMPMRPEQSARMPLDIIEHAARGTFVALMDCFSIADLVANRTTQQLAGFDYSLIRSACPALQAVPPDSCHERPDAHAAHSCC